MKLSIIILNYNVRYFLEQCIRSVQCAVQNIDAEVIVIDNNSLDGSCQMVRDLFPAVTLIENKKNVGFSKANNQAVRVAKGEYVCILNPDTAVSEKTFIETLAYAESLPKLGALGVFLMDGTGSFLPESKRNIPTPNASLLKLMGFGKKYYASHISSIDRGEVEILVGAFMLLKRDVYKEIKGFDEDYFMYGEDIDFSYKIWKAGYKNYYLGSTTVLHYKGESTQKDAVYLDRFYGAMQIFYKKHFHTNFIFNTSVKIGVFIAKNIHKKSKKIPPTNANIDTYILTENLNLLKNITTTLNAPIKSVSKSIFNDAEIKNTQFIFDVDYMSYSQIFNVMKTHAGNGNSYRIIPSGSNFMLGSDQSDQKGSVVIFS